MQTATIAESNLALLLGITLQTKAGVYERTTKIRMYKKTVSRLQDKNIISKEKDLPVAIKMKSPASCKLWTARMLKGITICSDAFSWTCQPNIKPHAYAYTTHRATSVFLGCLHAWTRQGSIVPTTSNAEIFGVIWRTLVMELMFWTVNLPGHLSLHRSKQHILSTKVSETRKILGIRWESVKCVHEKC